MIDELNEAKRLAAYWEEEAKRYCANAEFWRLKAAAWTATDAEPPPPGLRIFWMDAQTNTVGYDTYFGESYRFNASHWMRIPAVGAA